MALLCVTAAGMLGLGCVSHPGSDAESPEIKERIRVAASTMDDALVIDCQLPGRLMALGSQRQYLASGPLLRLTAIDCRTRGGEYTIGDLSGGTLSLKRWKPLAQEGDPEAQYFVARIYANGMNGVPVDYVQAADWYGRAAKQNFKPAMQELGFLYESGLGVPQDRLLALNLERNATGLGDELDYAWKLTAAKEESTRRAAELSGQLEASNGELESLRERLSQTRDRLAQSRVGLKHAEDIALQLRAQLQTQQGSAESAKLKALQGKLGDNEQALAQARGDTDKLRAEAALQQSALESRLLSSRSASLELNEVLSAQVEESKSLRARLAQSEQRLIGAQQELSDLRLDYRRQVDQLAEQRDALDQALTKAQNNDAAAALRAVKEHDFELQTLRVHSLEGELIKLRAAQTLAAAQAAESHQAEAQNAALRAQLADQQARYAEQVKQLQTQKDEMAALRAKAQNNDATAALRADKERDFEQQTLRVHSLEGELAKLRTAQTLAAAQAAESHQAELQNAVLRAQLADQQTRCAEQVKQLQVQKDEMAALRSKSQAEQAAMFNQLSAQLSQRTVELAERQHHMQALESDTVMLHAELERLRGQQAEQREASTDATLRAQVMLQSAQQKIIDQRDQIELLRTEAAQERAAQLADRNLLEQQLAEGRRLAERDVTALNLEIKARQAVIQAKEERIAAMEKKLVETTRSVAVPPPVAAVTVTPVDPRTSLAGATFYALVIGNSNYRHLAAVPTPTKDASSVGDLLEQRYGFKVSRLLDATADDIMRTLDNYSIDLKEGDRLLIYYAGHGDTRVGPPERAFWLGVDADPRTQTGWIAAESVSDKIKQIKAKHILLVSDSCFNSSITHALTTTLKRSLSDRRFQIEWNRRARMVLTSGDDTPMVDASGDPEHSRFAAFFLSVLRQNDGPLSGEMLSYELGSRMQAQANGGRPPTYSSLQDTNHDNGDFYFLPAAVPVARLN